MNWDAAIERLMSILKWLWYFVYVQFLFLIGTLAGLVIGGLFPSLYSSILIAKELAGPDADYFATQRYVKIYRAIFWKSTEIGYITAFILLVCLSNIIFFNQLQNTASWAFYMKMAWFVLTLIVMASLSLVSPTFVNYRLKLRQLPRLVLAGLSDPQSVLIILFGSAALGIGILYLTGIFLYIILGTLIFLIAFANKSFERRKVTFEPRGDGAPAKVTAGIS